MNAEERKRAGAAVAARIDELGTTAAAVARKAGIHPDTLSAIIHGRRWPQERTRRKLARALDVAYGEFARRAVTGVSVEQASTQSLIHELCRREACSDL